MDGPRIDGELGIARGKERSILKVGRASDEVER